MYIKRIIFAIFLFLGLCFGSYQFFKYILTSEEKIIAPLAETQVASVTTTPVETISAETRSLKTVIDEALEGTKGIYDIVIKNLKTGESFYLNEHKFLTLEVYINSGLWQPFINKSKTEC